MDEAPPDKRFPRWLVVALCLTPVAAMIGVGACAASLDFDIPTLDSGEEPIPVPQTACPYLAQVRERAARLTELWEQPVLAGAPWPQTRDRIVDNLASFELELVAAEPHVPDRVRAELVAVVEKVRVGRLTVPRSSNWADAATTHEFGEGLDALTNASDLVGPACGEPLYTG